MALVVWPIRFFSSACRCSLASWAGVFLRVCRRCWACCQQVAVEQEEQIFAQPDFLGFQRAQFALEPDGYIEVKCFQCFDFFPELLKLVNIVVEAFLLLAKSFIFAGSDFNELGRGLHVGKWFEWKCKVAKKPKTSRCKGWYCRNPQMVSCSPKKQTHFLCQSL
jgi:hypothetical protein